VINFEGVGPEFPVDQIMMHEIIDPLLKGDVLKGVLDIEDPHFGMVWTNIGIDFFEEMEIKFGDEVQTDITCGGEVKYSTVLPYCRTFSDVPKNEELVYNNEIGNLAIATNLGSFVEKFSISTGNDWRVSFKKV
jgi:S-adenosylmethionine hydrolase